MIIATKVVELSSRLGTFLFMVLDLFIYYVPQTPTQKKKIKINKYTRALTKNLARIYTVG